MNTLKIKKNSRTIKAEKKEDYTKASYLVADQLQRMGESVKNAVEKKRAPVDIQGQGAKHWHEEL